MFSSRHTMRCISGAIVVLLVCLRALSVHAADNKAMHVFISGAPFPDVDLSADLFDAAAASDFRLHFSCGAHKHECGRFTVKSTQDTKFSTFICLDNVPVEWPSGTPVLAAVRRLGSSSHTSVHVGFSMSENVLSDLPVETYFGKIAPVSSQAGTAHAEFVAWALAWHQDPTSVTIAAGMKYAMLRQQELDLLVQEFPEEVCNRRLPSALIASLPAEVTPFIEENLDGMAELTILIEDHEDFQKTVPAVTIGDRVITRYSSGHRRDAQTAHSVPVWGVVLRKSVAVISKYAAREADSTEFSALRESISSAKIAVIGGSPIVVPITLDIQDLGAHIALQDLSDHPVPTPRAVSKRSTEAALADQPPSPIAIRQVKTLLYIIATFLNDANPPVLQDCMYSIGNASIYYSVGSYGKVVKFVTTWRSVQLSKTAAEYTDYSFIDAEVKPLLDVKVADYDHYSIRYSGGPGSWAGLASVGGRGMWLKSTATSVFVHELGHNLGLQHSNYMRTDVAYTVRSIAPYVDVGYGHPNDWMATASSIANHFNIAQKDRATFLAYDNFHLPMTSGVYDLYAHDIPTLLDRSRKQGIRIPRSRFLMPERNEFNYYIEYRVQALKGISINLARLGFSRVTYLIDPSPMQPNGPSDAFLPVGSTYVDEYIQLYVTNLGPVAGSNPPYAQVDIRFGPFATNNNPTGSLTGPAALNLTTNGTFSVTASDVDGDALSYTWYSDYNIVQAAHDATSVQLSWNTVGNKIVRAHVSDRRGGLTILTWSVQVGNMSLVKGSTMRGTVRNSITNVPIAGAHIFWPNPYRGARTGVDGTYTIGDVPINLNNSLTAQSPDCRSLTPTFNNDIKNTAVATYTNMDWTCVPISKVSISALTSALTNQSTSSFRVTRYGGDQTASLDVLITCTADAMAVLVDNNSTIPRTFNVTIPANQASVDIPVMHNRVDPLLGDQHMLVLCFVGDSFLYLPRSPQGASIRLIGYQGPANDDFVNAALVTDVTASGTFNNASTEVNEPSTKEQEWKICPSVWHRWVAPVTGEATIIVNSTLTINVQAYVGDDLAALYSAMPIYFRRTTPPPFWVTQGVEYKIALTACGLPKRYYIGTKIYNPSSAPQAYSFTINAVAEANLPAPIDPWSTYSPALDNLSPTATSTNTDGAASLLPTLALTAFAILFVLFL